MASRKERRGGTLQLWAVGNQAMSYSKAKVDAFVEKLLNGPGQIKVETGAVNTSNVSLKSTALASEFRSLEYWERANVPL